MAKKSALIIGAFTKTENGFKGKLDTLAVKANIVLERVEDKVNDKYPDYVIATEDDREIGAAWDREDDMGRPFVSLNFEEPSLAKGSYSLFKTGAEHGYTLTFRHSWKKKEEGKK